MVVFLSRVAQVRKRGVFMNVLVTGGAGYIGSHTFYAFLDAGITPVVIDNLSTGYRFLLPEEISFYEGCVSDTLLIKDIIQKHKIDTILHFAGSIRVEESVTNPHLYYKNNTENSRALIQCAAEEGVKRFIFSSTAATYGNVDQQKPLTEQTEQKPASPYGWSKLFVEQILKDTAHAYPSFNYGILRYFNVAGADPKGRTGQVCEGATHLLKIASEVAVGERESMAVFGTDYPTVDGTCVRDYIHVSDLAEAHLLLATHMEKASENFRFNCGYGEGFSVLDVLNRYEEVIGRSLNYTKEGRRAGDPPYLVADSSALKQAISWTPKYNQLETIIKTALDWEEKAQNYQ